MLKYWTELKRVNIFLKAFTLFVIIGLLGQYFLRLYSLLSTNYLIKSTSVYMLDTFSLQGRGYEYKGGKNSSPRFEFASQSGYSFTIDKAIFQAIIDKQQLHDTLMYHGINFIPFTDRETFDRYKQEKNPFHINILQFQIGNKKYVDLEKANRIEKRSLLREAFITPVLIFFIIFFAIRYESWTDGEKSVWGAVFIGTIISLYFLL